MKKLLFLLVNLVIISNLATAQSVTLATTTTNPTKGTVVYNNSTNQLQYWNGTAWIPITNAATGTGWAASGSDISNANSGNVGIGTNTPKSTFNVAEGKTVIFGADSSGSGNKLIWYPSKGAFRAGYGYSNNWNYANIGLFSTALGYNPTASGNYSTSMGYGTTASGNFSVAMGESTIGRGSFSTAMGIITTAHGNGSTAMGFNTTANGDYSTTMGGNTKANEDYSTAMGLDATSTGIASTAMGNGTTASGAASIATGYHTTAMGGVSTAMGSSTTASGFASIATGYQTTASGSFSTAMGINASTNSFDHSFCISGSPGNNFQYYTNNTAANQMMMKFDNYTFFIGQTNFAYMIPSTNGWAYQSDKTKKENFQELDGENVLKKIVHIPFYSWNFKEKEIRQYRHYGIMAQDFYQNFGKDNFGTIGNDTTVSALDLLGVAYASIKALEKRTQILKDENTQLKSEIADLQAIVQRIEKLEALLNDKKIKPITDK